MDTIRDVFALMWPNAKDHWTCIDWDFAGWHRSNNHRRYTVQ